MQSYYKGCADVNLLRSEPADFNAIRIGARARYMELHVELEQYGA